MLTVNLTRCKVKAVRADMLAGRVTISFETHLDEEVLDAKRTLALLAVDESPVDITVVEQQLRLPGLSPSGSGSIETRQAKAVLETETG